MYSSIPYLNNGWSSWAIYRFYLRYLLYYIAVWLGASPSVPLTDPTKMKGVAQWPEPQDKREVQQFLGFCNFYCQFIPGFAQVAKPLTELMGKKAWKWQEEERSTFNKLKNKMTNLPTCKGTSRVVLSEFWGSVLLMAQWQIVYCTPIVPDSSCLCHMVWCLLLVVLGHSVIIGWLPWCCVPDYLV